MAALPMNIPTVRHKRPVTPPLHTHLPPLAGLVVVHILVITLVISYPTMLIVVPIVVGADGLLVWDITRTLHRRSIEDWVVRDIRVLNPFSYTPSPWERVVNAAVWVIAPEHDKRHLPMHPA